MSTTLSKIDSVLLMGPGPSLIYPSVYEALARPTLGHLDPAFIAIMDRIKEQLRELFRTKNMMTMPMSGTGSAGMETCLVNLIERGDRVLVLVNGVFGTRMAEISRRLGAEVTTLDFEWGTAVDTARVGEALQSESYDIVAVVHAETSTGVLSPVREIGGLVAETGALYVVDTVTSLGGIEVSVDEWKIDAVYSGTQKCLSCPPGLAPTSFSQRAMDRLAKRSSKVPNWYLDLSLIANYWEGSTRSYHHTAPINMLYALHQSLDEILTEGLEHAWTRHRENHERLVAGLEKLGLEMLVSPEARLPMLNAVRVPDGVDEAAVRRALRSDHLIEIGAGLGPLAGKIWRIGLMGYTARPENVDRFLDALRKVL
jgi:alanine-glyoxylate transaminase/serine-glyoxylate transaminase/serine-pyruvate transaminase